jgi:hypothetical protein
MGRRHEPPNVVPRGETGVRPGAWRILDLEIVAEGAVDHEVEDIRDDTASLEIPRKSGAVRARIGGCLGVLAALSIAAIVLEFLLSQ